MVAAGVGGVVSDGCAQFGGGEGLVACKCNSKDIVGKCPPMLVELDYWGVIRVVWSEDGDERLNDPLCFGRGQSQGPFDAVVDCGCFVGCVGVYWGWDNAGVLPLQWRLLLLLPRGWWHD